MHMASSFIISFKIPFSQQENLSDANTSLLLSGQAASDSTAHTFTDELSPKKSEKLFQFRRKRRHGCNKDSSDTESSYEGSDDESKQTPSTKQAAVSSPGKPVILLNKFHLQGNR